jgi:SNF2 family DNA or RNA helicase
MDVVSAVKVDLEPAPLPAGLAPGYLALLDRLHQRRSVDEAGSRLVDQALALWARPGFDTFLSLADLRFEPFDYQLRAAATVLRRMRGRAILADEVGLGKTIEACLVLTELRLRGLARQILILVPPGLVEQWREELERKFGLPSAILTGRGLPPVQPDPPVLLASLAAARRPPLQGTLAARKWDLVIADEAHRLKNPRSASAKAVQALSTRHLLLLTATPVENRLEDLFHLTSLVSPGLLGSAREFRARHGSGSGQPRNLAALRAATQEVLVRHRRSEVALMLPRRLARTISVNPFPDEAALYAAVSERVRSEGREAPPSRRLGLLATQRLAGSSPAALGAPLAKAGWDDLAAAAGGLGPTAKALTLVELLRRHHRAGEQVVVFTAFRQTLDYLAGVLAGAGIESAVYHGGLARSAKEQAVEGFRAGAPALLTTEAAGEGRNLQFCHVMVNFDLPWNPMQIEQRLGRIHRIGQTHDVILHNLVARGTVEEQILRLLETRINLFELVVGELDMILGRIDEEFDFESFVFHAHLASADDAEFAGRLDELGNGIAEARRSYLRTREGTDRLVGHSEAGSAGHSEAGPGTPEGGW